MCQAQPTFKAYSIDHLSQEELEGGEIIQPSPRWLYLVMSYKLASFRLNFYLNFW